MVLLGKLAPSAQKGNMPKLHAETLLHALLCIASSLSASALLLHQPLSGTTCPPQAPPRRAKLGFVTPPFFLLCSTEVPPRSCTCLTIACLPTTNTGGKGEAAEGPDVLALLPLQLPSQ